MKKPFQLNQNQETAGEAFRRIADDHGYPVGEDGKIVDSGFHPGNWPDGQPKEFIAPKKPRRGDTVLVKSVLTNEPPELVGIVNGFEDDGRIWVHTYCGSHIYAPESIIRTLQNSES